MWIQLLTSLAWLSMNIVEGARRDCGGTLTASRGIISTPNFPGPFNVPVDCEWVIDAQHVWSPNTTITVYMTQLFVFEGLTFTEYQLYGSDYKINPQLVHRVNETNISKVRWIQTYHSFLVIRLKLLTADSAHLRVLDKFLDVYGFNITYEISTEAVRRNSCTMMDCGFTGNCYDYHSYFSCRCFPGYAGPHCSSGPKSLCDASGFPTCRNGGTCIHVGVAAVKCVCTKNFTGITCEKPVSDTSVTGCSTCRTACPINGRLQKECKCLDKQNMNSTITPFAGRVGFSTTMHFSNLPILEDELLKKYIGKQILRNLQMNSSRVEDVVIRNIVHFRSGVDVTFHVFSSKKEEKRLRSILNKWADRGYVGNITISERDTSLRSLLSLQSLAINQEGIIRENDEFILSCVARGSPTMTFRWFKDGALINATSTSGKWVKLIRDPHVADQYTALLAVETAHVYDEGVFTCQVEDFGIQQCLSRVVTIGKRPVVNIEPMSITVRKGENFTVKCVTMDKTGSNKFTYSWTKNKELLPVRTEIEKYEILYPTGTILQVQNAEKDVQYSCLVQDGTSSTEKIVAIHVVDRKSVYTCPQETFLQMLWPETAPDTNSVLRCPKGYTGLAERYCALRDGRRPAWSLPSFSECTNSELQEIYDAFNRLKLGYLTTTPERILRGFTNYINKTFSHSLLPGEGARLLTMSQEVMVFISKSQVSAEEARNISNSLFNLINRVFLYKHSLTKQSEIRMLLELIHVHLSALASHLVALVTTYDYHVFFETIDLTILNLSRTEDNEYFHIPDFFQKSTRQNYWSGVQISGTNIVNKMNDNARLVSAVVFRNLSSFLPPRSFLRLKDGSELEYEIYSQILTILPLPKFLNIYPIAIDFEHELNNNLNWSSNDGTWSIKCGYADLSTFTYTWDIYSCYTEMLSDSKTRCICPKSGIFALLLTLIPESSDEDSDPQQFIVVTGCCLGMVLSFFTTACLATSCFLMKKSWLMALKLQCSVAIFATGFMFTLATVTGPPQSYFMLFITALETFLLLAMSSHLSTLLIVFTDIIQLPKPMTSRYTVMGIISGVPVITVFGSHLSYKTMDIKLESWWMLKGTLSFNIFVGVTSMMTVLFIFIYVVVMKKLNELIGIHEKYSKSIKKRVSLLRRSGCIFSAITIFSVSSLIYINYPNKLWSVYQFSVYNVFLGLILLFCYVIKAETRFQQMFDNKTKPNSEDKFFTFDSMSKPLNFTTKQDPEVENGCGSRPQTDCHQLSMLGRETSKPLTTTTKSQSIAATFESCLHTSTSFCDSQVDVTSSSTEAPQPPLELYNSSPQNYRKYPGVTKQCSPDILSNKMCVELDLVASSLKSTKKTPPRVFTPDDAIANILETELVIVRPEIRSYRERTQPDGHDGCILAETTLETVEEVNELEVDTPVCAHVEPSSVENKDQTVSVVCSDKLDGMLDSISQDLEYLLNKTDVPPTSSLKRVAKSPKRNISSELIEDLTEVPESISLRTSC